MSLHPTSILLILATACGSQSALIGEQDEALAGGKPKAADDSGSAAETSSNGTSPPPETGPCEDTTEIGLPPEEVATRLANLMFDSSPSSELLNAAQNGELATYGQVECQALDMIEQSEHQAGLLAFLDAWLEFSSWQHAPHPELAESVWAEMQGEASSFLESFVASGDTTLAHLLTEPQTTIGAALAAHYGVDPVPQQGSALVAVPGHEGVLALGLLNASRGRIGQRGFWVARKFLCIDVAPSVGQSLFEPIVGTGDPKAVEPGEGQSYRSAYDAAIDSPACSGCHGLFDGPGHALESFDALGRLQTTDAGEPVRTDGQLPTDLTGEVLFEAFDDTSDFIARLADNPLVGACLAQRAAGFVRGLEPRGTATVLSETELQKVVERFEQKSRDLSHLLVALTQTDSFWE